MTEKKYCANMRVGKEILRIWKEEDTMKEEKILDPIAIGIRKKIAEKGISQKLVAGRAGFTEQQLSDMLNNRKIIRACDLFRISEALGVEVADLLAECRPSA